MTTRHISTASTRLSAVVVLFALVVTACGTSSTAIAADRALEAPALEAPTLEAPTLEARTLEASPVEVSPLEASPVEVSSVEPAPAGGHEYGATLEEWTEVEQGAEGTEAEENQNLPSPDFAAIEWQDLIPPGFSGAEVVARFEERLDAVEIGSAEAEALYDEMRAEWDPEAINTDLAGQKIRLAGFVAPLTYDDDIVTEFLLVPTFGACIHVPPPPPNQTVLVVVDKADGLTIDETWGAVWVEGTLVLDATTTDLAAASYTISNATSGVYDGV